MNTKRMTGLLMLSALLLGSSALVAHAAYLDDEGANSGRREFVPPERLPGPVVPPGPDNPLRRLVRRVEIGRPYAYGRLAIFPLELREADALPEIRTLDEALSRNWITIREQDRAQVSEVVVRNESRQTVFMMAGEIIGGGRQDRIIRNDVLVTPGRDTVAVPVYCGEQDRWKGANESFDRAPYLAGQAMRSMAARSASQEAMWTEIDQRLKQSRVPAPTRSYQSLYDDRDTRRRIDDVAGRFRDIRNRRTVGLVIVDSGRIVSGDLFGDRDLCARLWDKIVRAHLADAGPDDHGRRFDYGISDASVSAVRRFLEELIWAGQSREPTPGSGESFALTGRVDGHTLIWNGSLIHVAAFPSEEVRPMPMPMPTL